MSFVFNQAVADILQGTLDLNIPASYYLHLVTAVPSNNALTVADLTISNATGYQPKLLLGQAFSNNILSFNDTTFAAMTTSTSIVGCVLCKRIGNSFANTDPIICFSEILAGTGAPIQIKPSLEKVTIDFGTNGAIKINDLYGYPSGNFQGVFPGNSGAFYLLGTNNNTSAFTNPIPSKTSTIISTESTGNAPSITDRNSSTFVSGVGKLGFDFGSDNTKKLKIKPGSVICLLGSSLIEIWVIIICGLGIMIRIRGGLLGGMSTKARFLIL